MNVINLLEIEKKDRKIKYKYNVSSEISNLFSNKDFIIEYTENVECVPDSILVIPFVSNILPIIWLTDSVLIVDEIDKSFFDCIPELKKGYEAMFPESKFRGQIFANKIVNNDKKLNTNNCAMFYSGGLDSVNTFIQHFEEKPALISIWGSDIRFDNERGWNLVHKNIEETALKYNLPDVVIHSSFREFDNEGELDRTFSKQLKDGWWHGVKHGIALLGHVAPYAYLHNLSKMYIASSHSTVNEPVRCASHPTTDNTVRFAGCRVIHDGYCFTRQEKTENIIQFCKQRNTTFPLHVCWETQTGDNCCHCEKCFRTIFSLIAEDGDPVNYGFLKVKDFLRKSKKVVFDSRQSAVFQAFWPDIQKTIINNASQIQNTEYWKDIKWIVSADFENQKTLGFPLLFCYEESCKLQEEIKKHIKNVLKKFYLWT